MTDALAQAARKALLAHQCGDTLEKAHQLDRIRKILAFWSVRACAGSAVN